MKIIYLVLAALLALGPTFTSCTPTPIVDPVEKSTEGDDGEVEEEDEDGQ
ncbi:hypothetical protein POV27_01620 [Aureisphaera galaxeae]|nr:hypothetical protein [Aureisphaera galaxeae]MDC8002738.1 hypothetical protein [Aureisphaera galaxeae]